MDTSDLDFSIVSQTPGLATMSGEMADRETDGEQQRGCLHVVAAVDAEAQVRAGVEEVERQRRRNRSHHARQTSSGDGYRADDRNEHEGDVGIEHVVSQRDEHAGNADWRRDTGCHPRCPRPTAAEIHD